MEYILIVSKALAIIYLLCTIFNLIIMAKPLTSKDLHNEIIHEMHKQDPKGGSPSRLEVLFVCVVLAPFMTQWIISDLLLGER